MQKLLCAFDNVDVALTSITRMIQAGLPRDDIHVQPEAEFYAVDKAPSRDAGRASKLASWLVDHFGMRVPPGEPGTYRDAVRRGSTVVVVHVASVDEALKAAGMMKSLGAFDVEILRTAWQAPRLTPRRAPSGA